MRVIDYSIRVSGWFLQNPGDTREMRVSWKVCFVTEAIYLLAQLTERDWVKDYFCRFVPAKP